MNRSKKLIVLCAVFAAACLVTFGVSKYETHVESIKNSDKIIAEIDVDNVTALSWKTEDTELSFHKDENWIYDGDEEFPVDDEKINNMLSVFEEFGAAFEIEDVEDYSQYGLDDPVCTISITSGDSDVLEVKLGDFSKMDSQRYVSIGDDNAYLVKTDPFDTFDVELKDMILDDTLPEVDTVTGIKFSGDIAYNIDYAEEGGISYQASDVYYVSDGSNKLPLDTALVDSYADTISNMQLSEYVTYNVTDDELASYGLDDPDLSVDMDCLIETTEDETQSYSFTVSISRDPEEKAAAEKEDKEETEKEDDGEYAETDDDDNITAYVRIGDSQIVYKLNGSTYSELMKATYNDLRHQEIYYGSYYNVTQIDISLEGESYTITSEGDDEERDYYYKDEELELAPFRSKLSAITAVEFTEDQPGEKEEISLVLHLDNEDYPQVEIAFYRKDGDTCLAVVDNEPVAYVDRSDVVDFIESVNSIVLN